MNKFEHKQQFIQEMKRRNYSQNTIENYASCIDVFFNNSTKPHPKNINENDIKQFLYQFQTPNTQRNYHSAIKKYYEIVLGQKNKFKYIPYARKEKKLPIILSVVEIQQMFDACDNLKHRTILALLYSGAFRVSELINLKWCHIDRKRMVINIIGAKGNKDRQVGLNEQLLIVLEEYWRKDKPHVYVLNGQNGGQYSERSVGEVVKGLAAKAGLKKRVYTHLIRHCSATHLLEQGTDISIIQKLLGHSSAKTTAIYTHISHNLISKVSPLGNVKIS